MYRDGNRLFPYLFHQVKGKEMVSYAARLVHILQEAVFGHVSRVCCSMPCTTYHYVTPTLRGYGPTGG